MKTKPITETIPDHLLPFVATQDNSLYTPMDHASWRYIMKVSKAFLGKYAHQKYLDGIEETGMSVERIPLISEMDEKMRNFGWRAIPVVGFIPPAVFMEFQYLGFLPIACDIRRSENIAYTPVPDIVHEAGGHGPLIADQDYANFLRHCGDINVKAIYTLEDVEVYFAIRELSDTKEDARSTEQDIQNAQDRLDRAVANNYYTSEATYLSRFMWWTSEYGMVGPMHDPKMYGAGLLSSVGESYDALKEGVKFVPFTLDCMAMSFDITRPQPQLFVAPSFETLTEAIDQYADTMAFRRGGIDGLAKAHMAKTTTTTELDSGVQISGVVGEFFSDENGTPTFLKMNGPTQISYDYKQLEGQGATYHKEGYSTPVGLIKGKGKNAAELTDSDWKSLGFDGAKKGRLEYESGIVLEGVLKKKYTRNSKNILILFEDCSVRLGDRVLFDPSWGPFDLACGDEVVSVFGGAADRTPFMKDTGGYNQKPAVPKTNLTDGNKALNQLYLQVREIRESKKVDPETLESVLKVLDKEHQDDWLLRLEIYELSLMHSLKASWESSVRDQLNALAKRLPDKKDLIRRGLAAVEGKIE